MLQQKELPIISELDVSVSHLVETKLSSTFDGKIVWYIVSVKLDLEARGIIERIPKTSPYRLRVKKLFAEFDISVFSQIANSTRSI